MRLTIVTMGFIAAYLWSFGDVLLRAWISPAFADAAKEPLQILAVSSVILAASGPAADVARGLGRPAWVLAYTASVSIMGLVAAWILVPGSGPSGAALALCLSFAAGTAPLHVVVAVRLLGLDIRELAVDLGPAIGAVLGAALLFAAGRSLASGLGAAILCGTVVSCVYATVTVYYVLTPAERNALGASAT
jgi:O-antigen/teichoic acid export membrane protein